jgi:hypothetical protein
VTARVEQNAADAADRRGRRQGGAAKLEDLHGFACSVRFSRTVRVSGGVNIFPLCPVLLMRGGAMKAAGLIGTVLLASVVCVTLASSTTGIRALSGIGCRNIAGPLRKAEHAVDCIRRSRRGVRPARRQLRPYVAALRRECPSAVSDCRTWLGSPTDSQSARRQPRRHHDHDARPARRQFTCCLAGPVDAG